MEIQKESYEKKLDQVKKFMGCEIHVLQHIVERQ